MNQNPMKNQAIRRESQSGNVLFIILIGIALFVALSLVMTRTSRVSSGELTDTQARLAATEILAYADAVRSGVKSLLISGVPPENVSFEMVSQSRQNGTPYIAAVNGCSVDSCKVFKPAGGGVSELNFENYATMDSWWDPNNVHVGGIDFMLARIEGVGTTASDFVMRVLQVNSAVCNELNKMVGLEGVSIVRDSGNFYGIYGDMKTKMAATDMYIYGLSNPKLNGARAFCTTDDRFIQLVVYAR